MPTFPFRVAMFSSSYAPLLLLLAYTNHSSTPAWIILTAVAVVSVVLLIGVMAFYRKQPGPRLTARHARPQDGDVLAYIATYLIPFFGLDLTQRHQTVAFVVFFAILMIIYTNSNMLFVNPLLFFAGYHTFEVEDSDGHTYALITRRADVPLDTPIKPAHISRFIRLEVTYER